jgi:hypothetical protein
MGTVKPFATLCAMAMVACNGLRTHAFAASTSAPPPKEFQESHEMQSKPKTSLESNSPQPATAPASVSLGERKWAFDDDALGGSPPGFAFGRTGSGRAGKWVVQVDPTAPSGKNVLAQLDADDTDYRFPVAVANEPLLRDGSVSVRCKSVSGSVDQACGLVFRYHDPDNYYVTRANALENNVRLYHVKNGSRQQFAGWNGTVSTGRWHALRVEAKGDHFEVYWEDKKIIDAHDSTFPDTGKIGVWTKADSVTHFDDLQVRATP